MMKKYEIDLHTHTCLSPCADNAMMPTAIILEAQRHGLDCIGICDHNSAENVPAMKRAGAREGMMVLGGMEITTREEVHILALIDEDDALLELQEMVYRHLPGENDPVRFGDQLVVDDADAIIGSCDRLLIGATDLSIEDTVQAILEKDGIAIASHIDREHFGIIGQLGFIPDHIPLHALELSPRVDERGKAAFAHLGYPLVTFSDAHYLWDIGKTSTEVVAESFSFSALKDSFTAAGS